MFPKLMIVDGIVEWFETEEELEEHVWDLMCNEAERYGDFDEENEDWSDFVDRNSDVKVKEYDETDHEHKMLPGAEDTRIGIVEYQKASIRQKAIENLERQIEWQTNKNKVDSELLQKGIDRAGKLIAELEELLDESK